MLNSLQQFWKSRKQSSNQHWRNFALWEGKNWMMWRTLKIFRKQLTCWESSELNKFDFTLFSKKSASYIVQHKYFSVIYSFTILRPNTLIKGRLKTLCIWRGKLLGGIGSKFRSCWTPGLRDKDRIFWIRILICPFSSHDRPYVYSMSTPGLPNLRPAKKFQKTRKLSKTYDFMSVIYK